MACLMREGLIFILQMALPGLQLIEQGIKVIAQAVQFSNMRGWHATIERSLTTRGVSHFSQLLQRSGDTA